jgi:hypothetical protein
MNGTDSYHCHKSRKATVRIDQSIDRNNVRVHRWVYCSLETIYPVKYLYDNE